MKIETVQNNTRNTIGYLHPEVEGGGVRSPEQSPTRPSCSHGTQNRVMTWGRGIKSLGVSYWKPTGSHNFYVRRFAEGGYPLQADLSETYLSKLTHRNH